MPRVLTTSFGAEGRRSRARGRHLDKGDTICIWSAMYTDHLLRSEAQDGFDAAAFNSYVKAAVVGSDAMDNQDLSAIKVATFPLVFRESSMSTAPEEDEVDRKSNRKNEGKGGGDGIVVTVLFVFLIIFGIVGSTVHKANKRSDLLTKNPLFKDFQMSHKPEPPTDAEGEENLDTV